MASIKYAASRSKWREVSGKILDLAHELGATRARCPAPATVYPYPHVDEVITLMARSMRTYCL